MKHAAAGVHRAVRHGCVQYSAPGHAQTRTGLPVVGLVLPPKSDSTGRNRVAAIRKGLQEAGLIEGINYSLAVRFAEGSRCLAPNGMSMRSLVQPMSFWVIR